MAMRHRELAMRDLDSYQLTLLRREPLCETTHSGSNRSVVHQPSTEQLVPDLDGLGREDVAMGPEDVALWVQAAFRVE